MLGDTAVAVHPDDERYKHLVGSTVTLPLVGRELTVIADDYVKLDFGTGCLKITPGHDPNDFEIGRRHGLESVTVIGEDGRMTAEAGEAFAGMTPLEARAAVVAALGERVVAQEPYTHEVPYSQRSGERIEPLISLQWFMAMDELARPAIEVVERGEVRIHPPTQARRYVEWLENIRPWCVSRQLWWGHQIPVWYRGEEERYCGLTPPEGDGWERDPDVLDTWFSSALWPFATLGWPDDTPELRAFYPTDVLSTARDILFLWVARMVMMGLRFAGAIPFEHVYVHSVIQAPDGRRMSKSLGTGIDPLELIEQHGADATRFGLLAMSSTQDVKFSAEKIEQGAKLAQKLYQASRLILGNVGDPTDADPSRIEDRWILSRLERAKREAAARIEEFDFSKLSLGLYDFVFSELCDWYLEMVKPRLYDGDAAAQSTALRVLEETLALAHPVIPFVTEEIWSSLPGERGLLAAARMPAFADARIDEAAERAVGDAIAAVRALRNWRESVEAKPGLFINATAPGAPDTEPLIAQLARFTWGDDGDPAATIPTPVGAVGVLATEGLDLGAAERKRETERSRLEQEIARAEGKLSNPGFVEKAPEPVVAAEREKLERLRAELEAL
jgi:valyl-tRNA synthetase